MIETIGILSSILGLIGVVWAIINFVFKPYFRRQEEFKKICTLVDDSYKRWKELSYSARGGTIISHDDFLVVNKYRSKFKKKTPEIKAYLLRSAIQNGLGGNWGSWLEMNRNNKKILLPLFLALNKSAGFRPAWRSAYILEKLFSGNISEIDSFILENKIYKINNEPILDVIKKCNVESELLKITKNGNKEDGEKCQYVIEEIETFSKIINSFLKEQSITVTSCNTTQITCT